MPNTIIVCGYGPGISNAVALKFGGQGFQVVIVARDGGKLAKVVPALNESGIKTVSLQADLSDPKSAASIVQQVQQRLGGIHAIHWNAYAGAAGNLLEASAADLHAAFDVAVTSLVAAVQSAHAELKANHGALLITNGFLGMFDRNADVAAVEWKAMGLAIANSAKHKLAGLLTEQLRADAITVGEVVVNGLVKGTAWDTGNATIDPAIVASHFWDMYSRHESKSVTVA